MPYELLRVDADGRVSDAVIIDAADDRAALARGAALRDGRAVEVWCGGQQVAMLTPSTGYRASPNRQS